MFANGVIQKVAHGEQPVTISECQTIPLPSELGAQEITQYTLQATFTAWAHLVGYISRIECSNKE